MEMDIVQIISQVGFPIAMATYFVVVFNKNLKENTQVLIKIAEKLDIEEGVN